MWHNGQRRKWTKCSVILDTTAPGKCTLARDAYCVVCADSHALRNCDLIGSDQCYWKSYLDVS